MIAPHCRDFAWLASVLTCVGLAWGLSVPVWAGMSIEGSPDALRLEANEASLEDVLATLRAKFDLRYHGSSALDGSITGTYEGSLARVASRLLGDYDFVIKRSAEAENVEIFVFRRHAQDDRPIVANSSPENAGGALSPVANFHQTTNTGVRQTASTGVVRPRGRVR
jgi:hypothetical protein